MLKKNFPLSRGPGAWGEYWRVGLRVASDRTKPVAGRSRCCSGGSGDGGKLEPAAGITTQEPGH